MSSEPWLVTPEEAWGFSSGADTDPSLIDTVEGREAALDCVCKPEDPTSDASPHVLHDGSRDVGIVIE